MSNAEWFRNPSWSEAIAADFEARLRRARRKEQYLRIQAHTLASVVPSAAHALLDRYFQLPDQVDQAQAHVDRAVAYLAQARVSEAIAAYRAALSRESEFLNLLTQAYVELPYLIAEQCVEHEYARTLDLLEKHRSRPMFPVDHFMWNAAKALILQAVGRTVEAKHFAACALQAASEPGCGLSHHSSLGLVGSSHARVIARVQRLHGA
jgi:hypothetical protein